MGVDPCELRAEQEDLCRVVHPHEQHDERSGGAEARREAAAAEVQADQRLADREQQRRHGGADPDVAPADANARNDLVDHREGHRHEHEAENEIEQLGERGPAAEPRRRELAERGDRGARHQREDEQEADAEHHPEREQAGANECPESAAAGPAGCAPDAVERVLQLAEDRDRADAEEDHADDGAEHALRRLVDALQQRLRRRRAVLAHQIAQLREDVAARRVWAEDEAGDRDDDQQQRRDREQRVVGERGAHARGVVVDPGVDRLSAERVKRGERHGVNPGAAGQGNAL